MRETKVEKHLRISVERRGGTCEKFSSPGRRGVPDRQVNDRPGHIDFVETKRPKTEGGKLKSWQERDHARRRARGFRVFVLDTIEKVDDYMANYYGR
jgi:hypothetical protein